MNRSNLCRWATSTALALAFSGAQAAVSFNTAGGCSKGVGGLLDNVPSLIVDCPGGMWVDPRPGAGSLASWSAAVSAGLLGAAASVAVDTKPLLGQTIPLALGIGAQGVAQLRDELFFNAPGFAGAMATMSFSMHIHGGMAANNSSPNAASRADWKFRAETTRASGSFLGAAQVGGGVTNFYDWGFTGNPLVDTLYTLQVPVVLGQQINFSLILEASAYGSGWRGGTSGSPTFMTPVQSAASATFGNTATWQGITSLSLSNGTPLTNWTLSSSSGFDYTQPVPEPATWLLMAGGLALLARKAGFLREVRGTSPKGL